MFKGSTTSLIEPSADKMSCDFTSSLLVQESTFPSTSQPPTSNSRLPTSQPTLPPTSVKIHLTLKPPSLFFTLTPTLPCCLHASWLCSCLSPWDLPPSHWSKPPPFSVLIGRGGRGRGHGGAEALLGWWASTTWANLGQQTLTHRDTQTPGKHNLHDQNKGSPDILFQKQPNHF